MINKCEVLPKAIEPIGWTTNIIDGGQAVLSCKVE